MTHAAITPIRVSPDAMPDYTLAWEEYLMDQEDEEIHIVDEWMSDTRVGLAAYESWLNAQLDVTPQDLDITLISAL